MADSAHPKAIENENGEQYDVDFGDAVISVTKDQASNKTEAIAVARKVYQTAPPTVDPEKENASE